MLHLFQQDGSTNFKHKYWKMYITFLKCTIRYIPDVMTTLYKKDVLKFIASVESDAFLLHSDELIGINNMSDKHH